MSPENKMDIRRAKPEQAARLSEIAHAAKSYWGYPQAWITHWHIDLTITAVYIQTNLVYAAYMADTVAGVYGLHVKQNHAELDHMWVDPAYIRQGIGRALFEHACGKAAQAGARSMHIVADPNAEGFYLRMGADKIGELAYTLDGKIRRLPRFEILLTDG